MIVVVKATEGYRDCHSCDANQRINSNLRITNLQIDIRDLLISIN